MNFNKTLRSTGLLTALAITVGVLAQSTPAIAEDAYIILRRVAIARTASELSFLAETNGTPIVGIDPTMNSTANLLHATGHLESATLLSLDDLSRGQDVSYGYLGAPEDGIPGGYYIGSLKIDDPGRPETGATWTLSTEDGGFVAEASGTFSIDGQLPGSGELLTLTCETTYIAGVEDDRSCVEIVAECAGITPNWSGTLAYQGCLKVAE